MNKKLFLTSALAMGFVAPAMAVPTNTGEFPSGGLMQADYTYTNAATSTNMDGVYEGTVNAVAQYTDILYNIAAGNYLAGGSELTDGTECPAGSWCPGLTNVTYSANDQGINTCPNGFTSSLAGSSSDTQCFRTCDISNMGTSFSNIAHATAVSGNDYYGAGTDTCEPSACENGWHIKQGLNGSTLLSTLDIDGYAYRDNNGSYHEEWSNNGAVAMGLESGSNKWSALYDDGVMLFGNARCSTVSAEWGDHHTTSELGAEGGQYCYCNVTGYKGTDGTLQSLSSPWVFHTNASIYIYPGSNGDSVAYCASHCINWCAEDMSNQNSSSADYAYEVLGVIESSPATCEANTITINWDGASQAAINANNAGTATYGSDIRTPQSAEHVPGKTFTGWRFSRPTQTNLPE